MKLNRCVKAGWCMLILLDHGTPRPLRQYLRGHTVHTAAQMGWDLLSDGALLTIAEEAGYNLLITPDQKIRHQQNLAGRKIAILVLMQNDWRLIRPHVGDVNAAIDRIQPGDYVEIEIPMPPLAECTGG